MDSRVRTILQGTYNKIFKLISEQMIFEKDQEDEVEETIGTLLGIEKLAKVEPNKFYKLATKKED